MSEIRGGMNVHTLNNMISWNVPYIVARILKGIMIVFTMMTISPKLTVIILINYSVFKLGIMEPLSKKEK